MCAISAGLVSCSGSSGNSDNGGRVNRRSWYVTGFKWPHDGQPFESDNCTIYSDGASDDARQDLAQLSEDALSEIKLGYFLFLLSYVSVGSRIPGRHKRPQKNV